LTQNQLELLRRLALNDEQALASLMSGDLGNQAQRQTKTGALNRIAALIALDAIAPSYGSAVDAAFAAGADDDDVIAVLIAIAPVVGTVRVSNAAPDLAFALGQNLDDRFEG
jgi:hypothetical protein